MRRDPNYIQPGDLQFVNIEPDADFDPEHNKRVIERTIKKYEAMRKKKQKEYMEQGAGERMQAAAQFIKSGTQGGKSTNIKKYFGNKYLAYLRGQQVIEMLKAAKEKEITVAMRKHAKAKQ